MKDYILIVLSILFYVLIAMVYLNTIDTIQKHSVHPVYGNYKKVNSDFERCSPWESCD